MEIGTNISESDYVKENLIDAALGSKNQATGIRVIIRDNEGKILATMCDQIWGMGLPCSYSRM